jgi:hypothetical protein
MALIPFDVLRALVAVGVKEVDVLVVVGSNNLCAVVVEYSASDVCQRRFFSSLKEFTLVPG